MANEKHLLLTVGGDYVNAALSSESWQTTLRLALVFGAVDPIGTFPDNWEPTGDIISRTETNWTIEGNWQASGPGAAEFHPDDYQHDQVAPAVVAWMNTTGISNQVRVRYAKLYPIGTDGKAVPAIPYSAGTPCTLTWTGSIPVGPATQNMLPLQNSIVISHRTAQIGRAGRGRMFRPGLTSLSTDALGQLVSASQTAIRDKQKAYLEGLKLTVAGVGSAQVRAVVTGSGFVNYAQINAVRVGSVPDTQRRRRRSLPETYSQAVVTA
jgi:hypothetical protein